VEGPSQEIALERIIPNPKQPRKVFDIAHMEELVASIQRHGVLQPIVVRPVGDKFELVSGERRTRASQIAGKATIPAVVRTDIRDDQMLELALVENVQRQDLDPIERATAFREMMLTLGLTQEQVADMVGLKRSSVANFLRLLDLPETIQSAIQKGLISMGHAKAMMALPTEQDLTQLLNRIVREELSVRETEKAVAETLRPRGATGTGADPITPASPPWVKDLEVRMMEKLGTKVALQNQPGFKGQIVIEYYNRADLERLLSILAPKDTI
jgi:ParB family chromosome partitioning protein